MLDFVKGRRYGLARRDNCNSFIMYKRANRYRCKQEKLNELAHDDPTMIYMKFA